MRHVSEIQQLIDFMRRGKRKRITISEYEELSSDKNWNKAKKALLINKIQKSEILCYKRVESNFFVEFK